MGNVTVAPASGSLPTMMVFALRNRGRGIGCPDTARGAFVTVVPVSLTGLGSSPMTSVLQPSSGLTATEVNELSVGNLTSILLVLAVGDSPGTLNFSWEYAPSVVVAGSTLPCADAAEAPRASVAVVAAGAAV